MELENLLNNIHISNNNTTYTINAINASNITNTINTTNEICITNIQLSREIFSHIISFSLAITKPKYDIAFQSKRVMEIYENMKYYIEHGVINTDTNNNILQMKFLIFDFFDSTLNCAIANFQNSQCYKYILESNNITKTNFTAMSKYILECFYTPCCEEYYNNWTQEQINILQYIIEYISNNWIDYEAEHYDESNYDFFFNDCIISTSENFM